MMLWTLPELVNFLKVTRIFAHRLLTKYYFRLKIKPLLMFRNMVKFKCRAEDAGSNPARHNPWMTTTQGNYFF